MIFKINLTKEIEMETISSIVSGTFLAIAVALTYVLIKNIIGGWHERR